MPTLELEDLRNGYVDTVRHVFDRGERISPRGVGTREVQGLELMVHRPWDVLPIGVGRSVNTKIAAVEALQLIGGVSCEDLLTRAVGDHDGTAAVGGTDFRAGGMFGGGYGPRTRTQLAGVVRVLRDDPSSRAAVMTIWDPQHDLASDGVSYICTIGFQFLLRSEGLQMHVNMRSNDCWLGLPYDAFMFTQLQMTIANLLGVRPGRYFHRAASMHLYDAHSELTGNLSHSTVRVVDQPAGLGQAGNVYVAQTDARDLLLGRPVWLRESSLEDPATLWYANRIAAIG